VTQVEDQSKVLQAQHVQPTFVVPPVQNVAASSEAARQPQSIAQTAIQVEDQSKFVQAQLQPAHVVPTAELSVAQAEAQPFESQSRPLVTRSENGGHESSGKVAALSMSESSSRSDEDASDDDDENDDETAFKEEMQRLDEDFKKNMLRAQKVFDSRMDNLQRSKEEREAQHLKTVEKHEKERAEFEKRLLQAEKEQNRRIEQLQREWDKKREKLYKHRKLAVAEEATLTEDRTVSEMSQANTESQLLDSLTISSGREKLVPPTYRSSDSDFSISSSSNGDSGSNSGRGGVLT
jgi:DNA polymerase III delta prime subunit